MPMWKRLVKRALLVSLFLIVVLAGGAWWAVRQSKKVPEFYERALAARTPETMVRSSQQLQAQVQRLRTELHGDSRDDVVEPGTWDACFTAEQINAWLVEELPKRFPGLAAKGLQEPRIMIEEQTLTAAARLQNRRIDAVLSCQLGVQLTDQPNRLAVTLKTVQVGALPLPVSQLKERIETFAQRVGVSLRWDHSQAEAVALIELPELSSSQRQRPILLESIRLGDQTLDVGGRRGDFTRHAFTPQGPVYVIAAHEDPPAEDPPAKVSLSIRNRHGEALPEHSSPR